MGASGTGFKSPLGLMTKSVLPNRAASASPPELRPAVCLAACGRCAASTTDPMCRQEVWKHALRPRSKSRGVLPERAVLFSDMLSITATGVTIGLGARRELQSTASGTLESFRDVSGQSSECFGCCARVLPKGATARLRHVTHLARISQRTMR